MNYDTLAVPERQLKPPQPPKAVSVSAIMRGSITCEQHHNPMASGLLQYTVTNRGTSGTAVAGEVRLKFIGCSCHYWRPIK